MMSLHLFAEGKDMSGSIRVAEFPKSAAVPVCASFSARCAAEVTAFHRTLPEYSATPLVSLDALSAFTGVSGIYVKDESYRFGLNAFKGLGGSYALHMLAREGQKKTFVTATDGNHGRGVAWAAARLGQEAYVYLPRGTARERLDNIRLLGAHAEIMDLCYDDVVRYAAKQAEENGWVLVQDTSWPGYEEIPLLIMQGYTTMGTEIVSQLGGIRPTHVFLQAGVGSMAAAMTAYLADVWQDAPPKFIIVEPHGANCIFRTAEANDGKLHFCGDDMQTIMAGLCCGEPCTLAWDILKSKADYALSVPDYAAADGMRILAAPLPGDRRVIAGESGASGFGAAMELLRDPDCASQRRQLDLGPDSVLLCINTEGATDRENYRRIVWDGAYAKQND